MRWRRLLRRRPEPTPHHSETACPTKGQKEAEMALKRAREARREIEAGRPVVQRIAAHLAREREANHFAELFRAALEGGND
jgi:hypothetical protein